MLTNETVCRKLLSDIVYIGKINFQWINLVKIVKKILNIWLKKYQHELDAMVAGDVRRQIFLQACIALFALNSLCFYFLPETFYDTRANIFVALSLLILLLVAKKEIYYFYIMYASLIISSLLISFVAMQSGGINSPVLLWLCTILLAALLLGGVFHGLIWWFIVQLLLLLLWFFTDSGYWIASVEFKSPMILVVCMSLILSTLIPYVIVQIYDQLNQKQLKFLDENNRNLRLTHEAIRLAQAHKDEFIAATGHELRTPLSAILGLTNMLLDLLQGESDRMEELHHIRRSTQHLLSVINNILDFSQLQAGKLILQADWTDLRGALDEVVDEQRDKAQSKELEINLKIANNTCTHVIIDRLRFKQIVRNLLDNSIRYSPENTSIEIILTSNHNALRLEVRDNGPGIKKKHQEHIFNRFKSGNIDRSNANHGPGLGLSICKELMDLNGGRIGVHSEACEGATFWVEWPASSVIMNSFERDFTDTPIELELQVLVVDDEIVNRMIVELQLRKAIPLAHIQTAACAQQAMQALKSSTFDIVLMDVYMPGMSGFDLAKWLRNQSAPLHNLLLIGLTASTHPDDFQQCLDAGMNVVLTKPLDIQKFLQNVHQHFQYRSEERQ